ncbi:class D sortase [Salicibibacter cibi]|uniref:Class D sortase n=1 Tax=Salicibibacter cibi TaxID=2743001 RepID=A0A7T6ZAV8_9BACI|nr:class D sortase [Salicibibacter cibi]QQK80047.1 class D sortase [Salicibibacter cibi]
MRKIGFVFIIFGLAIVSWFSYEHWVGTQSVEDIERDVIKATEEAESYAPLLSDDQKDLDENDFSEDDSASQDFNTGENVAKLVIPKLDKAYEVYWGQDEDTLSGGVGMYDSEWTTTPAGGGHTVLSGHRDTVFRPVGDLNDGDTLYVNYEGVDYEYEVEKYWITDENDHSVIVDKEDPTLTLTTCYPFEYIGDAPDRYIIQGNLVNKGDLLNEF